MSLAVNSNPHPAVQPDPIQFREYKLLLKADQFDKPEAFHEFWKVVRRTAKELQIDSTKPTVASQTLIREVLFFDTPRFALYNANFILRKRTFYRDGWPEREHRLALKYRHHDRETATAVDVRPAIPVASKIRFKEELLLARGRLGGMRAIYSHGCVLDSPNVDLNRRVADIASVFPVLKQFGIQPRARMDVVNNLAIEEVFEEVGRLYFGDKVVGEATVAIWRNRATQAPLVGEFAYQIRFDSLEQLHRKPRELSEALYRNLQLEAPEWIFLANTKTNLVYRLGNGPVNNDE